jgi:dihydroorotase
LNLPSEKEGRKEMYDILLRDAEIIDPSQGIHTSGSVAIREGKIAALGKDIYNTKAKEVFDMRGKIVVPGLIDIHCHPASGLIWFGVPADEVGLNTGVTLLCDGGSSGAANFDTFRRFIINSAKTEIFCFLNLAASGLTRLPEIRSEHDIDMELSKSTVEANRDIIKGIKIRAIEPLAEGLGINGVAVAKKLATNLRLPVMVHLGETRPRVSDDKMDDFSRAVVSLLEKGDILSHYLTWEPGGMILKEGTIYPELELAQKRGVVLDSCHGLNHFSFTIARQALAKGFVPSVISTDMASMGRPVLQSLAVVMSKFLNMGLSIDQVIEMTTINPAKALGEEMQYGSLKPGRRADITIMELVKGDFLFSDGNGCESMHGEVLLEPRMVFKAGKEMPAYSAYRIPPLFT